MKDIGVNEGTVTAIVAEGTATVDATTTGTTTDPGKLTEGTTEGTTGTPKATMVAMKSTELKFVRRLQEYIELTGLIVNFLYCLSVD